MKPQRVPSRADAAVQPAASAPREVCWKAFYDRQRRVEAVGGKLANNPFMQKNQESKAVSPTAAGRLALVCGGSSGAPAVSAIGYSWSLAAARLQVPLLENSLGVGIVK